MAKIILLEKTSKCGLIVLEIRGKTTGYIGEHNSRSREYIDRKVTGYLATGNFVYKHARPWEMPHV